MHRIFRVKAYEKEHGPHFNGISTTLIKLGKSQQLSVMKK